MQELVALQEEEALIDVQLRGLRKRYAEMSKLKETSSKVGDALNVQRDRLSVAKWLRSLEAQAICPVCESTLRDRNASLDELVGILESVEGNLQRIQATPAAFNREIVRVQKEIDFELERLTGVTIRRVEVERRSQTVREASYKASETSRFLGTLDRGLEMQEVLGVDGTLQEEIEKLRGRQKRLSLIVSGAGIEQRQRSALGRITAFSTRILPGLDAERPNDPIELSITDLTLRVKGRTREDYLWEIGSGANWLAYHVTISLALQQFFLEDLRSPVPGFLVYDQPSQVYFPRKLAGMGQSATDDPALPDEDIEAVRKVFAVFSKLVADAKGKLQVIVLDHASDSVWGDVPNVHLVEEWRGGLKLVPTDWIDHE